MLGRCRIMLACSVLIACAGNMQEKLGALIPVQTQWLPRRGRREAGYKLLTPRSLILDTQLID